MDNYSIVNLDVLGRRIPEEETYVFCFLKSVHLAPIFKIFYFCLAGREDAHEDKLKHLTVEFKALLSRVKDFISES